VTSIDPKTGAKTVDPKLVPGDGETKFICPHTGGARSWLPTSYDPPTKLIYIPVVESCGELTPVAAGERANLTTGVRFEGLAGAAVPPGSTKPAPVCYPATTVAQLRTVRTFVEVRPSSAHSDGRDRGWGRRGTSLMGQPAKRAGAKASWIGLTGSSKLHNFLGNNGCTFVGAVSQLRRVARHSIGGAHRLDHLRAKTPIREAVWHQRFLRSPGMPSPTGQ
jgi:hypothetical protein